MKTRTKVWLGIAACLVLLGGILFVGVMSALGWDFTKLSTVRYETNTYELSDDFDSISITTDTADIVFAVSNGDQCRVVCYEEENAKHAVTVKDGALIVEMMDERSLYDFIGLSFDTPKITVYLPKAQYSSLFVEASTSDVQIPMGFSFGNVDISVSTGDICAEGISVGTLDISVSTGEVYLADIRCENIISKGRTGDITLKNVIATEKLSIQRSTGDVRLENADAAEIYIETDTGDVTGTLLSDKIFAVETDTGHVRVPKTETGGKCKIITDTGDIKISLVQ